MPRFRAVDTFCDHAKGKVCGSVSAVHLIVDGIVLCCVLCWRFCLIRRLISARGKVLLDRTNTFKTSYRSSGLGKKTGAGVNSFKRLVSGKGTGSFFRNIQNTHVSSLFQHFALGLGAGSKG